MVKSSNSSPPPVSENEPEWLLIVQRHVSALRFGVVQIVVHDGRVTQIEKTERVRLPSPPAEE